MNIINKSLKRKEGINLELFKEKLVSESIGDKAYNLIKKWIIQGKLSSGERLKEEELCVSLDVSRTPLRDALKRLELEGWVIKAPGGGVRVSYISTKEVKELYEIRGVLEGLLVRESVPNIDRNVLDKLEDLIDKMEKAASLQDSQLVIDYGHKFHSTIYEASNNQKCMEILGNVIEHIKRYRYIGVDSIPNRGIRAGDEHRKILEAIMSGDLDRAEQAMREHIRQGSQAVLETISRFIEEHQINNDNPKKD